MSEQLSTEDILAAAKLSRLAIDDATAVAYAGSLQKILAMMNVLDSVDTDNIKPLANIHENQQSLRTDTATTDIDRSANQSVAPSVADGLYLVPQVIE
ncbi:aspartyl/glutamyl-tRNA(Asn/Gln) amidotransferase subunit C [Moraxella cuniculi DSM 21768]|uniref:Aspartyl/glutamyl-tRNA(Asn/Gln) amidotransferase subunit C n=1 Tax=Moraxella cuniculi DSM 21768 TaxID=1122245 RepID=A0A1N7FDY6_9GAMM|nr:Asp-tRNA(Asn)/Glu-tRNA(Gln) amidotransferase subunit GatC [Moraxella cuniculi]OOS07036.1 asparaginyl/glutamyl-tRNA amidotransferase subunit C [Moraxella cuniculi]SIR98533.1 aspartyl/glutamyl-tRNA(Asn/Gln) amidotransferase subunit C [Moraxella cuniculi DSM 21768]